MTDNNPWANAQKNNDVQVPKNIDKLIDAILQFVMKNGAHETLNAINTSLGIMFESLEKKDLENIRTIFDQMKFNVIDVLSKKGWK